MKAFLNVVMYTFSIVIAIGILVISVILRGIAPDWLVAISDISFILFDLVIPVIIGLIVLTGITKVSK
jgi:hypothetical protein